MPEAMYVRLKYPIFPAMYAGLVPPALNRSPGQPRDGARTKSSLMHASINSLPNDIKLFPSRFAVREEIALPIKLCTRRARCAQCEKAQAPAAIAIDNVRDIVFDLVVERGTERGQKVA